MFNKLQLGTQPASLLAKTKLSSSAALVLLKMMYHVNRMNMVVGTPETISDMSGVRLHDFHRGLRALKKLDFIRKYTKKEYMLNPDVMTRQSVQSIIDRWPEYAPRKRYRRRK